MSCAALAACTAGSASAPPSSAAAAPRAIGSVKQVMRILDPSADAVWSSVGTIVSTAGTEERAPRTDEEWEAVLLHALTVAESGNLLMLPGRATDADAWMERAAALVNAGAEAARAAQERNAQGVLTAGERITDACDRCHQTYWKEWHDTDITQ